MAQRHFATWFFIAITLTQEPIVRAQLGAPAPAVYDAGKPRGPESLANCVVDVGISAVFLGKAGLGINAAVNTCEKNPLFSNRRRHWPNRRRSVTISPTERAACSASVSGLVSAFFFSASFASLAAADCEKSLQVTDQKMVRTAQCVADFNFVFAGMALIAQAGSEIYQVCPSLLEQAARNQWAKFWDKNFDGNDAIADDSVRRLSELSEKYLKKGSHEHLMDHDGTGLNDTKVMEALDVATQKLKHLVPEAADFKEQAAEALEARRLKAFKLPGLNIPIPTPAPPTPAPTMGKLFKVITAAKQRQAEEAECAFDVGQATFFLARASLMINAAVQDCSSASLYEGNNQGRAVCSVDLTSLIAAFSFVASGISYAVFHCPAWKLGTQSACAGSIINLVSALAEIAAAGSDFGNSCSAQPVEHPGTKEARRLSTRNSTVV